MEYSAITHLMEKRYCYALGNGRFAIRLETKKDDVSSVILHYKDKYIPVDYFDTREKKDMVKVASDKYKDYYEVIIDIDVICLRYQFEITDNEGNVTFYGNYDFYDEIIMNNDRLFDLPQNLREEEIFEIPKWAENKVVYQIFPSRFATTDCISEKNWYKAPITNMDKLHGNLRGIINMMEHMRELGVDVIYMTPIFWSDSSHKYDTIDYYKIDPEFGCEEDLKELVAKAHSFGMKVVLDAVFNHTSPKFFAFEDVRHNKEKSRYKDWYYVESFPVKYGSRKEKPNFKSFAYFGGMPKLNLNNPEAGSYFIDVAKYWIQKCDIDGWRLDVGDEISHCFWKKFRREIKAVKRDVLIIGEIWHYAGDFLEGDEWDTVMNYPFYLAVLDFAAKGISTASQFLENLDFIKGKVHSKVNGVLWNLIDSHDTARFMHICGEDKEKMRLAAALQLLLPGMPMIYYGDEYGMTGGNDPDCRRGMVWDEKYQDKNMYNWYRGLINVRRNEKALTEGKLVESYTDDGEGIICHIRELNDRKITIIFHGKEKAVDLSSYKGINGGELWKYKGLTELITMKEFDGILKGYETLVFSH